MNLDILPLGKRAHLEQARAAQQKAAAQEQSQEQQIRLAVSRAFTSHQTAERMVATARAAMDQSTESLRILRNRYDAGLATMTDLLRAEDAERQSQNELLACRLWKHRCLCRPAVRHRPAHIRFRGDPAMKRALSLPFVLTPCCCWAARTAATPLPHRRRPCRQRSCTASPRRRRR